MAVSANHPLMPYILKPDGKLVIVGVPEKPFELPAIPLIMGRKIVGGTSIGGIKEMLEFSAKHGITELIPIDYVNTAIDRLVKSDVRYRFVIDVANSLKSP